MRNLILLAGTAALALAVPVAAEKGGKGGGHGGGGGKPAKVEHGSGHGGGGHGGGGHGGGKPSRMEHGGGQGGGHHAMRASRAPKAERHVFRAERKAERHAYRSDRPDRQVRRSIRDERRQDHFVHRSGEDRRDFRRIGRDLPRMPEFRSDERRFAGYGGTCPPGLARKGNGCLPPGQAKKLFARGERIERDWFDGYRVPAAYQSFYQDTPDYYYSYDEGGYIYRADRGSDLIDAIIPLFGGGFGIGQPLPAGYDAYNVPIQYRDDYYDTDESSYRYGDNAIYRVDNQSGMIEGIVALLGGGLNVGQELPDGYDAYNLPMDYRDDYQDGDEYNYRYADGNIYQVDAKTQIIQAIMEMVA